MSVSVIFGKPGSGKSYHCVSTILKNLEDWIDFERKEGKPFDRVLYTNLPLNIDNINQYFYDLYRQEIDVSRYIFILDSSFFMEPVLLTDDFGGTLKDESGKTKYKFWWDNFPDNSLIVIDEVHKYIGSELSYVSSIEVVAGLRDWISTHRHKRQDIIFLTQAPENIHRSVLAIVETTTMITNPKNLYLPFPFNVPLSDVDVVLKAFGVQRQYYLAQYGEYRGRSIRFTGVVTRHVMSPTVFRCYTSNTLLAESEQSKVGGDAPLRFVGRFAGVRSLFWFMRRHAWHLVLKFGLMIVVAGIVISLFRSLPSILMSSFRFGDNVKVSDSGPSVLENDLSDFVEAPINPKYDINQGYKNNLKLLKNTEDITSEESIISLPDKSFYPRITAYFPDCFYIENGRRYNVGDELDFLENKDVIDEINYYFKEVFLSDGSVYPRDFDRVQPVPVVPSGSGPAEAGISDENGSSN